MDVTEFDFVLPDELIALRPAVPRDAARMLVVHADGRLDHAIVRDLPNYLRAGDAIVLNDTKVIHARLRGHRIGRGASAPKVELLLGKRIGSDRFLALARPARKLAVGDTLALGQSLAATVVSRREAGEIEVRLTTMEGDLDKIIEAEGEIPLPPYIAAKRKVDDRDLLDYQTVFAAREGSIAAPTAGLHFSEELLSQLSSKGVQRETVTLHVGTGTFLPVSADDTDAHRMHPEWVSLSAATAAHLGDLRRKGGRIVAVGTTTLRAMESAADSTGAIGAFAGETSIFITPGYRFHTAEILLTNFHLPRSTLFMLVSAYCGLATAKAVYAEAVREKYRFYSYGDACLLFRRPA